MSEYIVKVYGQMPDAIYERAIEEIVRCRDCKYFTYADAAHGDDDWCAKHDHIGWSVNGFCAWGERRQT